MENTEMTTEYTGPTPLLDCWKTNALLTAAGVLIAAVLGSIGLNQTMQLVIGIAYPAIAAYYCFAVYPSYFSSKPKSTNPNTVSLLNAILGGLIFGLLWNSNLTKKTMGISHKVYGVLCIISVVVMIITAIMGV